jgi:hypothetical protein
MEKTYEISAKDFDGLTQCGVFGRTEKAFRSFSVVVCGQGDHFRARVWERMKAVKVGTAPTAAEALAQVVRRVDS